MVCVRGADCCSQQNITNRVIQGLRPLQRSPVRAHARGVTYIMIKAEVRSKAYFALALVPSVYWGFWCAFGILFFGPAILGNWAGIPLLALCIIGLSGLAYSLKTLWAKGETKPKVMLVRACIYLCLAFVLGSVVWVQFVPSQLGIYFGWWLIFVASVAAIDLLAQYLTIRSSRPPSAAA